MFVGGMDLIGGLKYDHVYRPRLWLRAMYDREARLINPMETWM